MRKWMITVGLIVSLSAPSYAQWTVYDPAVTYRNSITAVLKEMLVDLQQQQRRQIRRMAQRLSMFTTLAKFRLEDPPRWRTHDSGGEGFLYSRDYQSALNFGDARGQAFLAASQPVEDPGPALGQLSRQAQRALLSELATLDLSDSAAISATHDTGQLRYNGRRELAAIDSLERDVTNDSLEQSTTAVLDKISGAGLVAARQRQARLQLLDGIVEQLLVEGKRSRDTEAAAMNMQLTSWRDRAIVNQAFAAGAGDALRTWRQP